MYKIVGFSHALIRDFIKNKDHVTALDATCGRGNDTLFIASLLQDKGTVDAYDIQEIAINSTKELIKENKLTNVNYFLDSHENINEELYDLSIFNLGYLPNGDKSITTNHDSTLKAIKKLTSKVVEKDSLIIICLYVGHEEGKLEADIIDEYCKKLPSKEFLVCKYQNYNRPTSPYIITISKNKRAAL